MSTRRLPETDEEKIDVLQATIAQEEINEECDKILPIFELRELKTLTVSFESAYHVLKQATADRDKSKNLYDDLFKNAQLYISHFIQVLLLTVIRNEIKAENLILYGLDENKPVLPDLSTEEAVLKWGENLMRGETERTYRGGIPLYNPAIAKVKVHYELFAESIRSLAVYEKNRLRLQNNIGEIRYKANDFIRMIWNKVEERYAKTSLDEQALRFKDYKMQYYYRKGEQMSVFD